MTAAAHCEAIKYAYRQSKEGTIVSFVLHPNEVPKALHDAAIGSRWMLALAEIGDDEKPKQSYEGDAPVPVPLTARDVASASEDASPSRRDGPSPDKESEVMQDTGLFIRENKTPPGVAANTPRRAVKVAPEKRLVQQAGILSNDTLFYQFMLKIVPYTGLLRSDDWQEWTAAAIREHCGVTSRSEIIPGSPAAAKWEKLTAEYEMWKRE